jgi:CBS domain containing-hemolysin-like protein
MDPLLIGIVVTLIFSGFFSGTEIAFFSANRLSIELGKEQSRAGRILSSFTRNASDFIGTLLVGNNIALVIFGILMADLLEPWLALRLPGEFLLLLGQTIITTLVVLVFGEFLPKTLFRVNPLATLRFLAIPLRIVHGLLWIPVQATTALARGILRRGFRLDLVETPPTFSKVDLQHFVEQNTRESDEHGGIDTELFENALYLKDVKVRECMVPRPEVVAVGINNSIDELRQAFVETGFSRLPIYFKELDNMLGYVHHFDIINRPPNIGTVIMTIPVVPETMTAKDLLNLFRREKKSIAQVVDEFGGTAGIVTMEDVLEELFGEIRDEHDDEDLLEQQLSANEYIFSGRLEIDYLNEQYGLNLPEGEYETLAGFLVAETGTIPEMGRSIQFDGFQFDILYASNKRIETIKLVVVGKDSEEAG